MELRQLKYFITVASELHFGRAAESLHLSQPALSKQIQALEDSLEIQLLERTKHWVRLTIAGQKFLETAHRILHEVEFGIQVTRQVADGEIGKLRIGFTETTLFSLAPEIVRTYRERYPQVELILTSRGTEAQVEALRTHQIDVGFVYLPIREPSLSIHPLFEEVYIAALPTSHWLARQKQIALQSLAKEPLIFYPRSLAPVLYANLIKCCEQAGFVPNIVQEAELAQTRLGLAAAGVGITFVLGDMQNLNAKGVVYRPLIENFLMLKLALAWRQNESSPVVHEFIKVFNTIKSIHDYSCS
ncbi:LysR family transcriptional regulator [Iningainema tapete]|uniref:LysR family transcriptional regulator n=1 Tax=Iningainema tapete BLCC-T55 TaxID=2748662 RepID=A0A8J6XKF9_9CYAN|nr:LysR family transcriptional regulator [Iningainema tapete]MBD2777834.1 LysR family transcriptional regulator [Iningainema tapete BLCC-T55]